MIRWRVEYGSKGDWIECTCDTEAELLYYVKWLTFIPVGVTFTYWRIT